MAMNDRDLVIALKAHKRQKDYETLYNRYLPMIRKYAFEVATTCVNLRSTHADQFEDIRDDFKQEAYLTLVNAVDYVELDKIKDDNWSFKIVFYYFLRTLQTTLYRSVFNNTDSLTLYLDSLETAGNQYTLVPPATIFEALSTPLNHYSELRDNRDELISKLSDRQREVVKRRQLGITIDEIRLELGVAFGTVVRDIRMAKKRLVNEVFILS